MFRYRVFKQTKTGSLHYAETSNALGDGRREIDIIAQEHALSEGDVIYIGDFWIRMLSIQEPHCEYEYMLSMEVPDITYGEESWGPLLISRLYSEAVRMERMRGRV